MIINLHLRIDVIIIIMFSELCLSWLLTRELCEHLHADTAAYVGLERKTQSLELKKKFLS